MKTLNKLKVVLILLFVTVVIFASFFGVYKKEDFRTVNKIKDYKLGMQFTDALIIKGTVKTLESESENESKSEGEEETEAVEFIKYTLNDYKQAQKIIKNRLNALKVGEYKLNLNEETGEITIKLQDSEDMHALENYIEEKGKLTIIDKETEEVLIDSSSVKTAKAVYGQSKTDTSTIVIYLQIEFNKEGAAKLEEISQTYVATTVNEENEEGETEEKEDIKYISVNLNDETLSSTYFGEKMTTGILYIPITGAKDSEELQAYVKEVNNIAAIINNGVLPVEYEFTEETVESTITKNNIFIGVLVPACMLLVGCIVLVIKFKEKGFICAFMQIGYVALLLLTVRYTNVILTIQGMVGIVLSVILNYVFNYIMLNNLNKNDKISWEVVRKFAKYTIPVYVIAVILAFNGLTVVNSLGMCLVWGSFCLYIYNLILTKPMLEMLNK